MVAFVSPRVTQVSHVAQITMPRGPKALAIALVVLKALLGHQHQTPHRKRVGLKPNSHRKICYEILESHITKLREIKKHREWFNVAKKNASSCPFYLQYPEIP